MKQVSPAAVQSVASTSSHPSASLPRSAGFTLIELLVVIGILGVLAAAILPAIVSGREQSQIFTDQANMRWHYQTLQAYRLQFKRWPKEGGHRFVLAPWIEGTITDKTPENRDRFFSPALRETDQRYQELRDDEPKDIWKTFNDLSSADTSYAGRAKKFLSGVNLESGNEALLANDNEFAPVFKNGTINVLVGDGNVRDLNIEELKKHGYPDDPKVDFVYEVGPNSPHPLLKKLDR